MSEPTRDVTVFLESADEDREQLNAGLLQEGMRISRALGGRLEALQRTGDEPSVEEVAALTASLLTSRGCPRLLLIADTDRGRELAPFLAQRAGTQALLGVADIEVVRAEKAAAGAGSAGAARAASVPATSADASAAIAAADLVYAKPVYGGQLEEELRFSPGRMEVVTLARSALLSEALRAAAGEVELGSITEVRGEGEDGPELLEKDRQRMSRLGKNRLKVRPPDFRTVDIVHARRIVAAGLGAEEPRTLERVKELAQLLEASLGTTRPLVDDGVMPKERMIGQTGKSVSPQLYLALGLSGSPHHVAGFQGAGRVLAVNRDPRAPIFGFADAGWVADVAEVLPRLLELIREYGAASGWAPGVAGTHGTLGAGDRGAAAPGAAGGEQP